VILLAACGAPAATPTAPTAPRDPDPVPANVDEPQVAIDPIAVLSPLRDQPVSWVTPGPVQLELGGSGIESPGGTRPIEIAIIERQGTSIRAAVRLEHARFSVWTARARLFGVLTRDVKIRPQGANPTSDKFALLRAGARVTRLARNKAKQTQIRYVGGIEVEGWVPDDALDDAGPGGVRGGRRPMGRRPAMMIPGSIIRTESKWGTNLVAVVNTSHMLDTVAELADGWIEVKYADGDVEVRGFTSRRQPPGTVHRQRDPDAPPPVITPNAKVPSGTCLFSKRSGDKIGYVVGDREVQLDDLGGGWWTLAVDTPWGPLPFAAKGPSASALTPCAPAGAVPAPVPVP
jgi:hypothetical protein